MELRSLARQKSLLYSQTRWGVEGDGMSGLSGRKKNIDLLLELDTGGETTVGCASGGW